MPGEHFVLKDLSFYERAREADAKACQEHLDQREEKRQERTPRKAPVKERAWREEVWRERTRIFSRGPFFDCKEEEKENHCAGSPGSVSGS